MSQTKNFPDNDITPVYEKIFFLHKINHRPVSVYEAFESLLEIDAKTNKNLHN